MASEVVCGLIFRLLLPICLAVGECGMLMVVTTDRRREGAWERASSQREGVLALWFCERLLRRRSGRGFRCVLFVV